MPQARCLGKFGSQERTPYPTGLQIGCFGTPKDAREAVVIRQFNWIELVIVTPDASQGLPKKGQPHLLNLIIHNVRPELQLVRGDNWRQAEAGFCRESDVGEAGRKVIPYSVRPIPDLGSR